MTAAAAERKARALHAAISANVDRFYVDDDYDAFNARARALWAKAQTDSQVGNRVLGLVRAGLPAVRS